MPVTLDCGFNERGTTVGYSGVRDRRQHPAELIDVFATGAQEIQPAIYDEGDPMLGQLVQLSSTPSTLIATDFNAFYANWITFSKGSLTDLNWNNIVVAGGSVCACLATDEFKEQVSRWQFFETKYPTSDIDIFLFGLTGSMVEEKVQEICNSVKRRVADPVEIIKTRYTTTITGSPVYRKIQIINRVYNDACHVIRSFDIDSCRFLFNGSKVMTTRRGLTALQFRCNTYLRGFPSPTYELRLLKYALRGFAVRIPAHEIRAVLDAENGAVQTETLYEAEGPKLILLLETRLRALPGFREKMDLLGEYEKAFPDKSYYADHYASVSA